MDKKTGEAVCALFNVLCWALGIVVLYLAGAHGILLVVGALLVNIHMSFKDDGRNDIYVNGHKVVERE